MGHESLGTLFHQRSAKRWLRVVDLFVDRGQRNPQIFLRPCRRMDRGLHAERHQRNDVDHRREEQLPLVLPSAVFLEHLIHPLRLEDPLEAELSHDRNRTTCDEPFKNRIQHHAADQRPAACTRQNLPNFTRAQMSSRRRWGGWRRGRGQPAALGPATHPTTSSGFALAFAVVRGGRVPRVLHAHSEIAVLGTLRIESTAAHDGEQTRADRTRHAVAGGSPSCSRCAKDLERAALKGFPNPPAFWLRRAKPGFAYAEAAYLATQSASGTVATCAFF